MYTMLCFALTDAEGVGGAGGLIGDADVSVLLFVTVDVLLKGLDEALGMLGCEDDTVAHLGLGNVGQDACEIDDEIAAGMCDDGEIGIFTLCNVLRQFDLQTLLGFILIVHNNFN